MIRLMVGIFPTSLMAFAIFGLIACSSVSQRDEAIAEGINDAFDRQIDCDNTVNMYEDVRCKLK